MSNLNINESFFIALGRHGSMEGFESSKRHTLPPEPIPVSPSKADQKKDKVSFLSPKFSPIHNIKYRDVRQTVPVQN